MTDSTASTSSASNSTGPREVRLVSRPVGWPTHDDFELVASRVLKPGDVVFVPGAAGAVGSAVGQIA